MKTNTSCTKTEAEAPEAAYCPVAYATLFNKGLERAVEVGKSSLDLVLEHNSEILASYKKALDTSFTPGPFLFDLAGQALEGYVAFHKSLLDLTVEQSTAFIDAAREYRQNARKAQAEIILAAQQSMDFTAPAKNPVKEVAADQVQAVSDIVSKPVQTDEDIVQRRIDALLAKEIVDLTVMQPAKPVQVEDIVQLRVDTLTAKDIVDLATKENKAVSNVLNDIRPAKKKIADPAKKPSKNKGPALN